MNNTKVKYQVEFTDSVADGRDFGQPFRTYKQNTDKIEMFRFYEKRLNEKGKRYGWEKPILSELVITEIDGDEAIKILKDFEKTKDCGQGI